MPGLNEWFFRFIRLFNLPAVVVFIIPLKVLHRR